MLQIDNLHATVADKPILKGLSLSINAGEIHAIMGPNGAGKSTLGYTLGGRPGYEVTGGSVTFAGQDLLALEPGSELARQVFASDPGEIIGFARANDSDYEPVRRIEQYLNADQP